MSRTIASDIAPTCPRRTTIGFGASGLLAIAANSNEIPAPLVNAAVAAAGNRGPLTDWIFPQGERVMGASIAADRA